MRQTISFIFGIVILLTTTLTFSADVKDLETVINTYDPQNPYHVDFVHNLGSVNEELVVGTDATGYDVKFYGTTSGSYFLWDHSEDKQWLVNSDLDVDGTVQIDNTLTTGINGTGYDVKFYGTTSGEYLLWDSSNAWLWLYGQGSAQLELEVARDDTGGANIQLARSGGTLGSPTAIKSGGIMGQLMFKGRDVNGNLLELSGIKGYMTGNIGSGVGTSNLGFGTANNGTLAYTTIMNSAGRWGFGGVTPQCSLDVNGGARFYGAAAPVYPTTGGQAFEINFDTDANAWTGATSGGQGTALFFAFARTGAAWQDLAFYSDNTVFKINGTTNILTLADTGNVGIGTGTAKATSKLEVIGTVTVGVNDTGHDVKFYGATSGAYMLWDESADNLIVTNDIYCANIYSGDMKMSNNWYFTEDDKLGVVLCSPGGKKLPITRGISIAPFFIVFIVLVLSWRRIREAFINWLVRNIHLKVHQLTITGKDTVYTDAIGERTANAGVTFNQGVHLKAGQKLYFDAA